MKYAHIISYVNSAPWAILEEKLHAIIQLIELRAASGIHLTDAEIEARIGPMNSEQRTVKGPSSVAVIPIIGTISHRAGLLTRSSGGASVETAREEFRAALGNPEVGAIVMEFDSPGGSTAGIEEFADEIFAARKKKRIVAVVNSLGASAAYWLASQAHQISVTASGHVGSIGVLGVHFDVSRKAEAEGVTVNVISAGKHKAEASEFSPLSDDARAHLQSIVDDRYDAFVRAVARGRSVPLRTVREGFGQGRLVTAKMALSTGMVDAIETMDQALSRTVERAARAKKIADAVSWKFDLVGDERIEAAEEILGQLQTTEAGIPEDPDAQYVEERLESGVIPRNVSEELAPEGTTWSAPTAEEFVRAGVLSSTNWDDNTDAQKRRVTMYAAWVPVMPPARFGDIKLFHHRASDGRVVPNGVRNARSRANQVQGIGSDLPRVEAHLENHMRRIQDRNAQALADPRLDPSRVEVELLELG